VSGSIDRAKLSTLERCMTLLGCINYRMLCSPRYLPYPEVPTPPKGKAGLASWKKLSLQTSEPVGQLLLIRS